MLLSGLMALHVGGFTAWVAAAAADAAGGDGRPARVWAPLFMLVCLGAGAASMTLSYPYYREQTWLWMKMAAAAPAAAMTVARAFGKATAARALRWVAVLGGLALALAFTRPF